MMTHSLKVLDCGLKVLMVPLPAVESITVLALSNIGSRYETKKQQGLAHFLEHMVFKGTQKYQTAQVLAETVDGIGANWNAFTSKEYTGFYIKTAGRHLGLASDVLSDMLFKPKLRKADLEREKGVIVEELNMYVDMPARHVGDLFDRMAFSESGLGHDIVGTKDSVTSFEPKDFSVFLDDWYGIENIVLVVAGSRKIIEKKETLDKINADFAKKSADRKGTDGKRDLKPFLLEQPFSRDRFHLEYKKTEQAHFVLGWPGLKHSNEQKYALSLLSIVVGGNMSSRLFSEVREKRGLCYYVRSESDMYHDTGMFGAAAGVDPSRVDEALKATLDEFTKISVSKAKITQEELSKAKEYLAGKMALSLEDSEAVAQFFGLKQLLINEVESPSQVLAKMQKVTLGEVQKLAESLVVAKEMRLAMIGPFKDKGRFEKIIEKY